MSGLATTDTMASGRLCELESSPWEVPKGVALTAAPGLGRVNGILILMAYSWKGGLCFMISNYVLLRTAYCIRGASHVIDSGS